jgi:sporulation protein YlmC with PRC-barrel domain
MANLNDPSDTGGQLIAASQVNGTNVYNRAGEKLGSVYDVMIDKQNGQVQYAIMSFGGFLGIGDSWPGKFMRG